MASTARPVSMDTASAPGCLAAAVDSRAVLRFVPILATLLAVAAAQDPIREVRRAFRPAEDAASMFAVRSAALDAVTAVADGRTFDTLLEAWTCVHQDARRVERKRVRPALQQAPSVTELAERAELDQCLHLLTEIEGRLTGATGPALDRALDALLTQSLPVQARAALMPVVARMADKALPRVRDSLRQAKRADDVWVGLRALEAMGKGGRPAGPEAEAGLTHREPFVRAQAARTLAAIDHRTSVPALIDHLGDDDARWRQTVADALERLTGQTFGGMLASWRAWWEAEGEVFVRDGASKKRAKPQPRPDAAATRSTYFGIPQDGRSVLYLVDFSQSMQNRMRADDATTRWQACTTELGEAIDRLAPGQSFNIVVFAQRVLAWSDHQLTADARNAGAAKAWLQDLRLELGTAVFEGFEVAFALGGAPIEDRAYAPQVDTIFFLSDGLPTVRRPQTPRKVEADDPDLVRALVRRRNPVGAVVVHAIMLGRAGGGPFMRQLAAENGGRFVMN